MDNSKVHTINDYIKYGKESSFTIPNCAIVKQIGKTVFLDRIAYDKYHDLLKMITVEEPLNDSQYERYKYRPDLVAYDYYGNPNLDHLILYLNSCSESEFDFKTIKIITANYIEAVFKRIMANVGKDVADSKKVIG